MDQVEIGEEVVEAITAGPLHEDERAPRRCGFVLSPVLGLQA